MSLNPFDYRNPVSSEDRFVGRRAKTTMILQSLDELDAGRPQHCAVTGPRFSGRTSLLRLVGWRAQSRGMLAVDWPLSRVAVESSDALAMNLLSAAAAATGKDPNWLEAALASAHSQPSQLGARVDAVAAILDKAAGDERGVFLLDDADALLHDQRCADLLASVGERVRAWNLYLGASDDFLDYAAELTPQLVRRLRRIPSAGDIETDDVSIDAIGQLLESGLAEASQQRVTVEFDEAIAFFVAAGPSLGDVTLLAHFAWRSADWFERTGEQKTFRLTDDGMRSALPVMRRLAGPALADQYDAYEREMTRIDALQQPDLELAAFGINFENMTNEEAALVRACLDVGFGTDAEKAIESWRERNNSDVERLCELGLAEQGEGRHTMKLSGFGRAYLRGRMGSECGRYPLIGGYQYRNLVMRRLGTDLRALLPAQSALVASENAPPDSYLPLADALRAGDVLGAVLQRPRWIQSSTVPPSGPKRSGLVFLVLTTSIYADSNCSLLIDQAASTQLFWYAGSLDSVEAEIRARIVEMEPIFRGYRLSVDGIQVATLAPELSDKLTAVVSSGSVSARSYAFFYAGRYDEGVHYLRGAADILARAADIPGLRGVAARARAEALINTTFFLALLRRSGESDGAFEELNERGTSHVFLSWLNEAFARAVRGEFAGAARLVRRAEEHFAEHGAPGGAVIVLFLPRSPEWSHPAPEDMTALVLENDVPELLRTQRFVYETLSGLYSKSEYVREAIAHEERLSTAAALRLIGRLNATRGDKDAARQALERALRDPASATAVRHDLEMLDAE